MAEAKKKETKDPNAKVTGWDIFDPQSLTRKVPIGPKFEELSRSKTYEMLGNEKRPSSHDAKDVTAALVHILPTALTASFTGSSNLKKAKKGISLVGDRILSKALDKAKAGRVLDKADEVNRIAKGYNSAVDDLDKAKDNLLAAKNLDRSLTHLPNSATNYAGKAGQEVAKAGAGVQSYLNMMKDYSNGMSLKQLADKYGDLPTEDISKFVKESKLSGNSEKDFFNFLKENNVKDIKDLNKGLRLTNSARDKLNETSVNAIVDYIGDLKPGEKKIIDTDNLVDTVKDALRNTIKEGENTTSKGVEDMITNFRKELVNETRTALNEVNNYGNTVENLVGKGKSPAITERGRSYIRGNIVHAAKKDKKYLDKFENIVNPSDPLYKFLNRKELEQSANKFGLADAIKETGSVTDAIQMTALEQAIAYYDETYIYEVEQAMKIAAGNSPTKAMKMTIPEVKNHPFRNVDGSLKDIDEIIKILTTEPKYIENVTKMVNGIAVNKANYAGYKAGSTAALPLTAQYVNRAIKNEVLNTYDPYGKTNALEKPWNPKLEFSKLRQGFDNLANVFNINFDLDPSRYTRSDIDALREAITYANNMYNVENPKQIEKLSDREILSLARSIGSGNYGNEFKNEALKKLSEIAPRIEKEKK